MVKASSSPQIKKPQRVSRGAGITVGLEIWTISSGSRDTQKSSFVLVDTSPDGRFADDVTTWNSAVGLNAKTLKQLKDAVTTKQDTA
jgi:hypothetical protein